MVKDITADPAITKAKAEELRASFDLDLIAFFKALEESVMDIVAEGAKQNYTPDEIVAAVEELFNE